MFPILPVAPVASTAGVTPDPAGELPLAQAAVVSVPERLAETPRLLTVGATAIAVSEEGVVQLRTPLGDLFLRPSTPLPLNRPLTLLIPPGSPPDQVFLSLNSAAPDSAAETRPIAAAAVSPTLPVATPALMKAGTIVPGLLFPTSQPAAPASMQAAAALTVSTLPAPSLPVLPVLPEEGSGSSQPQPAALPRTVAERAAPAAPAQAAEYPSPPSKAVPLSNSGFASVPQALEVEILATNADQAPLPAMGAKPRLILSGTVVGTTTQNRPLVATPQGLLVLELPTNIAVGEKLTLAVSPRQAPGLPDITPLQFATETDWPALAQAVGTLAAADSAANRLLRAGLPKPGPHLAPALALFLNVLRGPLARDWPGERVLESLRAERRGDVADALAADIRWAAEQSAQPNASGWRCHVIPFLDEGQLTRFQFAVRQDPEGAEGALESERRERRTRFVIDVSPSRLGPVQLDGLLGKARLDMVLRCRRPLTVPIIAQIKEIFSRSIESTGLKGAISVQAAGVDWTTIAPGRTRVGVTA